MLDRDTINELVTSERRTVVEILSEGRTPLKLAEIATNALDYATSLVEEMRQKPVACKEGCAYCCRLHVGVTGPETIAIVEHLRTTLSAEELEAVKARVATLDDQTRGMDSVQRARTGLPCALLVDNRCSVYPVRPLSCQGWNSFDVAKCEQSSARPLTTIPSDAMQIALCHTIRQGLKEGLGQAGLSGADLELTAALRIALNDPESAAKYLAKEPVFEAAKSKPGAIPF
jgi:Fe-S-cluster containining protein